MHYIKRAYIYVTRKKVHTIMVASLLLGTGLLFSTSFLTNFVIETLTNYINESASPVVTTVYNYEKAYDEHHDKTHEEMMDILSKRSKLVSSDIEQLGDQSSVAYYDYSFEYVVYGRISKSCSK